MKKKLTPAEETFLVSRLPKVDLATKVAGENIMEDIMGSHWCVRCYPKNKVHAYFIFKGNSLCEEHLKITYENTKNR